MTLGERIKQAREDKGLSQIRLAVETNIGVASIQRYERDELSPSVDKLIQISEALKVPISRLITIESVEKNTDKEIYLKAINTFGANQQIIKAMEELGELSTALARYFTKKDDEANFNNIYEEIADIEIMLSQLRLIFDSYVIDYYKEMKLNRLEGVVW